MYSNLLFFTVYVFYCQSRGCAPAEWGRRLLSSTSSAVSWMAASSTVLCWQLHHVIGNEDLFFIILLLLFFGGGGGIEFSGTANALVCLKAHFCLHFYGFLESGELPHEPVSSPKSPFPPGLSELPGKCLGAFSYVMTSASDI